MQIHEDIRFQRMIEQMEALYMQGCIDEMQQILEKLQTLAETEQDSIGLAAAYFYRDILHPQNEDSKVDMQYGMRALKIAQTQNIPYYEMKASNSMGIMYSETSDFHSSLEYYLRAIHIAETHPEFCYAAVVLNNVGNLFVWLEDYDEAVIYLERAYCKSIVENKDDKELIGVIVSNLIELYSNAEEYDKARQWEEKSRNLLTKEDQELTGYIELINEARQCAKAGRQKESKEKILTFIRQPFEHSSYMYAFRCCFNALKMTILMKDFELSRQLIEKLEIMQSTCSISTFAYDYALIRIEYYRAFSNQIQQGNTEYYEEYFKQSQERIEQLRNTYAKSLAVKLAYEDMKDENLNVHMQNELLQKDVEKDIFTNLFNKVSTEKYVCEAMEKRPKDKIQGLILIDIDLFKRVNDNYGHGIGDKVIMGVADILEALDSEGKIVGRFGGDEFLLLLDHQDHVDAIRKLAEQLLERVQSDIQLPDDRIGRITLSIGICIIDGDISFEEAFSQADQALYRAKELGRNRYVLSTAAL